MDAETTGLEYGHDEVQDNRTTDTTLATTRMKEPSPKRPKEVPTATAAVLKSDGRIPQLPVLVVAANPALQKTIFVESFSPGKVNRASKVVHGLGGKGQNAARALASLNQHRGRWSHGSSGTSSAEPLSVGIPVTGSDVQRRSPVQSLPASAAIQFVAGEAGSDVHSALAAQGVLPISVQLPTGETRTATTIRSVASDAVYVETEIIDPSPNAEGFDNHFISASRTTAERILAHHRRCVVLVMGTAPLGVLDTLYSETVASVYSAAQNLGLPQTAVTVIVDGYKEPSLSLLRSGTVDILKLNKTELFRLAEVFAQQPYESKSLANDSPCTEIATEIASRCKLTHIVVTDGANDTICVSTTCCSGSQPQSYRIPVPPVRVVNAIGCGDVFAATLAFGLVQQEKMKRALQTASCAASAAAVTTQAADIDFDKLAALMANGGRGH